MGRGSVLSIFPCQLLHAVGCPFDCPNIVCLIAFPNINQTPKQNYPSQPEKIKISKRKRTRRLSEYIPIYQSSLQCDVCWPNHLMTRPVTKGRASPPWRNFLLPWKNVLCITVVLVHGFDVKFVPPLENSLSLLMCQAGYWSAGDCCLVTSVSYATQPSLFTIKFFMLNTKL